MNPFAALLLFLLAVVQFARVEAATSTSAMEAFGLQVPTVDYTGHQKRDAAISRDIRKGDSTLAGYMNGVDGKLDIAKMYISNGNIPAAMAIDDEIKCVVNANLDSILRYSNMQNVQPGSLAERMRGIARRLRDGAFLSDKVTFGGREYTYGLLLRSDVGRLAVEESVGNTLLSLGFHRTVARFLIRGTADEMADVLHAGDPRRVNLLVNSDTTAAACMRILAYGDLKAATQLGFVPDPSRAVRSGIANELAANWKDYFMTFGSATEAFTSRSIASFGNAGGHRMMPAMRDYAIRLSTRTGLTGKALVDEAFLQYNDWKTYYTRTGGMFRLGKRPDSLDVVGVNEQNAAISGAISELSRMDSDFDLREESSHEKVITRARKLLHNIPETKNVVMPPRRNCGGDRR